MKKILSVFLMLMLATTPVMAGPVIDSKENPEYLFVISSGSGSFEGDTLTLTGVPLVVYFSDRPYRVAGHMSLEKFAEMWSEGPNSLKADPPNATLSILDESGNKDSVVEISDLQLKGDSLTFKVRILEGSILKSFGAASIFIDATFAVMPVNPGLVGVISL